jgi:bifunctional UDP-N-acetylglucosamine pyrophosphorylase/glucosamine-1-phosphate N-acetyltransferase
VEVPPGARAVSAGAQRNIEDWVLHNRADSDSAKAAAAAKAKPPAPRIDPDQG